MARDTVGRAQPGPDAGDDASAAAMANLAAAAAMPIEAKDDSDSDVGSPVPDAAQVRKEIAETRLRMIALEKLLERKD